MLDFFDGILLSLVYGFLIVLFDGILLIFLDGFFDINDNLLGLADDVMLNLVKRPIAGISPSWTDKFLLGLAYGSFNANILGLPDGFFLRLFGRRFL